MDGPRQYSPFEAMPPGMLQRANALERVAFEARRYLEGFDEPGDRPTTRELEAAVDELEALERR